MLVSIVACLVTGWMRISVFDIDLHLELIVGLVIQVFISLKVRSCIVLTILNFSHASGGTF